MSDIQNENTTKPEAKLNLQGESEMILREAVAFALGEALEADDKLRREIGERVKAQLRFVQVGATQKSV